MSDFLEESKQEFGEEEPRPKEMEGDAAPAELSDRQPRNNGHVFVYQTATDNEGGENRDDQDEQGNIRGFIDYGDEEDMDDEDEEYGDFLDNDDLDLIEENLGVKVKRRKMYKRIKTLDDEEDDGDLKDCIAQDLFHGVAESELEEGEVVEEPLPQADDDEGEDEKSDINDFIVGDNDQLLPKKKGNKLSGSTAVACQGAKELFGGSSAFADLNADAKQGRKSILEIYEPSELESHYMTDQDKEIRATDMPERFQLRSIPVKPCEDHELEGEAEWIFRHGFSSPTVSTQDSTNYLDKGTTTNCSQKGLSMVAKIKEALNFMRNQQFEVPFIAFYRKEYVEPELNINDLWKVWQWDEKWTRFQTRKQNITRLFQQMQSRQLEQISAEPDVTRPLDTADMERLKDVQTVEELGDVHSHFLLYYGRDIPKRQNAAKANKNSLQRIEEEKKGPYFRQPSRRDTYSICQSRGLDCLAKNFGLTPEQFGENLRDGYQHYETRQFPAEPVEMAKDYVCSRLSTPEAVLEATRYMVAIQIAHEPLVRHVLRQTFQERAKINTKPTVKGEKEIDEAHFARSFKYVKNKPVQELDGDQFLRMCLAEDEGLLSVDISIDLVRDKRHAGDQTYFDEIKQLYYKEEFSHQIQEWNRQRSLAIETSLTQVLYPQMAKELKNKLMAEAKESVVRSCRSRLFNWLKVAPYKPDQLVEEDDDLMDENQGEGIRVLGVAYSPSRNTPVFCALINGEGEVTDVLRLPNFMKRRNAFREDERGKKAQDVEKLKKFLTSKKPHVVAVAGENRDANMIIEDIKMTISELEQESSLLTMRVELVDNELAKLYMNSKKSEVDFVDYPPLLRQAVSIGRKVQDPLMEYAQVCSTDDDILCLKLHPLQHVAKEDLLPALDCEFINRVCEVGVDVNKALCYPHTQSLVQYVCGLGPRKGSHLLKILKHNGTRLTNRVQLMTVCHMGPRVFTNCAGFIKIDTAYLGDSTDPYIDVLDRSRVHPEAYEWARKIAVDALDCDVSAEADPLEEISENPQPLKDLDLDAFAELLEREGHGKKGITLYDICAELSCKYKDIRVPYRQPNTEEIFNLLTKETPETFYVGMLTTSVVTGIARQLPNKGHYEPAICNNATKLWQCPFCRQDNFPEVSEVVDHIDSGSCRGRAFGVWSQLDNGIQGFIPTKFLSDKVVKHPEEKVKVGMAVDCRVTKISFEKLRVDLTCRTSDLSDETNVLKFPKDKYYDYDAESEDHKQEEDLTKKQQQTPYIRLEFNHPNFHNITFMQAERMMETLRQGDVIFRPSSKAENHLTLTWKVTDDIHQPVDVIEEGKENAFSLGRWFRISDEKFEDLDEIVARYVVPMTLFARDLLRHKYFQGCSGGNKEKMAELLVRTMRKKPAYMAYFISASKELPGKFLLGYQPGENPRCEYVTVTPHGYRFRSRIFPTVDTLFCWFKAHYHEPVPGSTPHSSHCR